MPQLDLDAGVVHTDLGPIALSPIERDLLRHLQEAAGRPVSREDLLRAVWGYAPGVRSRTVDTTVQRLRAKIEEDPACPALLVTVRGEGYAWAGGDSPAPAPAPARSASIPRLERIVGREDELRELTALLHAGHRLITLTGPSGVGKSQLARHALTRIADRGRRRVWFAEVSPALAPSDLIDLVASALELQIPLQDPDQQVLDALRLAGPALGVIDDAQGLDDDALRLLSRWIQAVPELALIVTSQRVLGLEGERRLPVEPLPEPDAVALLQERLEALALPLPPSEALAALADRVGRLPLALELAAALLDALSVEELLEDPDLLAWSSERPDAPARHRSLRAAIGASTSCLDASTLAALLSLSVFAGPFPAAAASALGVQGALVALRRRSFLSRHPDGRLVMYDGVRAWAREQLQAQGGWEQASQAHARWLAQRDREGGDDLTQADLVQALRGSPDPRDFATLVNALLRIAGYRGPISRMADLVRGLMRPDRPPTERIMLLSALSDAHIMLNKPDPDPALQALALADQHGDEDQAVVALTRVSASLLGRPDALPYAREAVARAEALGKPMLRYKALCALGNALDDQRLPGAVESFERAARLAEQVGEPVFTAVAWGSRGKAQSTLGRKEAALDDYRRALAAVGDDQPRLTAMVTANLGGALVDLGRLDEAEQALAEASRAAGRVGDVAVRAAIELRSVDIDLLRHRGARARRRLQALVDGDELSSGHKNTASVMLAVLSGDATVLRDRTHPLPQAALALLAGQPLPEDLHPEYLRRLELAARARET